MKTLASLCLLAAVLTASSGCITYERRTVEPEHVVVTETPVTTTTRVIKVLPEGYTTTVYRGTTYYQYGKVYYRSVPGGYVTVEHLY